MFLLQTVQDRNLRTYSRYIVYGWPLRNKFIHPLGKQSLLTQNQCPCMQQIDKACVCVFFKGIGDCTSACIMHSVDSVA